MLIDVTGITLTPGNMGKDCLGNGEHFDDIGNLIECLCDECDYMLCCFGMQTDCDTCNDRDCPQAKALDR